MKTICFIQLIKMFDALDNRSRVDVLGVEGRIKILPPQLAFLCRECGSEELCYCDENALTRQIEQPNSESGTKPPGRGLFAVERKIFVGSVRESFWKRKKMELVLSHKIVSAEIGAKQ